LDGGKFVTAVAAVADRVPDAPSGNLIGMRSIVVPIKGRRKALGGAWLIGCVLTVSVIVIETSERNRS
jgi:hypothetical protein